MNRTTSHKIVVITQKTRLEDLIKRYNTEEQAKFYIKHQGVDFSDYQKEHFTYCQSLKTALEFLEGYARVQVIDRKFLPSYIFGPSDLVIAIGRDGLVANAMKYLSTQKIVGVNPDPERWDGVLLPFSASDLKMIIPEVYSNHRKTEKVTFAIAKLNDGQTLSAVNDLFIGQKTHTSARYSISIAGRSEVQSSSGIIVSTGLGSTGWLKSIVAGANGIEAFLSGNNKKEMNLKMRWDANYLFFTVREPYPSTSTGATVSFGEIKEGNPLVVRSLMPENGVIFSDGVENDFLEFNSGTVAEIGIDQRKGQLVV